MRAGGCSYYHAAMSYDLRLDTTRWGRVEVGADSLKSPTIALHGAARQRQRRLVPRTRWSTGQGSGESGLWWRWRIITAASYEGFLEGGAFEPEIRTVEQAVSFFQGKAARILPVTFLSDAGEHLALSRAYEHAATELSLGRLAGVHVSGACSIAWRLVEARD